MERRKKNIAPDVFSSAKRGFVYLIHHLMIRFVCREKLRVPSPSCRGNLISRLDSDCDIRCEKRCGENSSGTEARHS